MGTFSSFTWGASAATPPAGSVLISDLIKPAFRIAGITDRPMREPSTDQYAEGLAILGRMIGNWNIRPLTIYSSLIASYALTTSKTYTIGPGGTFDAVRPVAIRGANILLGRTPEFRKPVKILTDDEWRAIQLQDIPGTIPGHLYNDQAAPLSTLYLWGQPVAGYSLELFTWRTITKPALIGDSISLPDGYELAITYNLAKLIASQFPTQARMSADAQETARTSLMHVMSHNSRAPVMGTGSVLGRGSGRTNYSDGQHQ